MKVVSTRGLSSATRLGLCVATLLVSAVSPCAARDKVTANTWIWRIVVGTDVTHYAQSIEASWASDTALAFGTVTYTPTQTPEKSHIESKDSWQVGSTPAGTIASWKGSQSGLAVGTSGGGLEYPPAPSGKQYRDVKFRDLQTKQQISADSFVADKVKAGDVQDLLPKHR